MIALVCIAKNEDLYLSEWINYHYKLGFDHIFIYQNDWRWNVSVRHPGAHYLEMDGPCQQISAYNDFLKTYGKNYEWVAFLDVDEFLVLKKHDSAKRFLRSFDGAPAVGINWALFGDNNQCAPILDYSCLRRFTKRNRDLISLIKSIVRPSLVKVTGIHGPDGVDIIGANGSMFRGSENPLGDLGVAQVNHYFCKTIMEFNAKRLRGRADLAADDRDYIRDIDDFHKHNYNDVNDFIARDFLYG